MEETKIKRPPSVWITQILLIIPAIVLAMEAFFRFGLFSMTMGKNPVGPITVLLYDIGVSALCFVAVNGMVKRKSFGRWLGVGILSLNCIRSIYAFIQIAMDETFRSKLMNRGTALVIGTITTSLMLFLIYRLAFGPAANAFFAKPGSEH